MVRSYSTKTTPIEVPSVQKIQKHRLPVKETVTSHFLSSSGGSS